MAQDMTDDRPDGLSGRRVRLRGRKSSSRQALPGLARTRIASRSPADKRDDVRLAGPAGLTEHAAARPARTTPSPLRLRRRRRTERTDRATASTPARAGTPARTGESVRDRNSASPRCRKVILAASNSLGCGSWRSVRSVSSSAM